MAGQSTDGLSRGRRDRRVRGGEDGRGRREGDGGKKRKRREGRECEDGYGMGTRQDRIPRERQSLKTQCRTKPVTKRARLRLTRRDGKDGKLRERDSRKRFAKEAYFIDIVSYRVQATLARGQMAPGSVPAGSGRAGNFSSSEILERVALGCGRVGLWPCLALGPWGLVVL